MFYSKKADNAHQAVLGDQKNADLLLSIFTPDLSYRPSFWHDEQESSEFGQYGFLGADNCNFSGADLDPYFFEITKNVSHCNILKLKSKRKYSLYQQKKARQYEQ